MVNPELMPAIHQGWSSYQQLMIDSLRPLTKAQLALRASPRLRSVGELAQHIVGARAYWFYHLMGEGGDIFKDFARWNDEETTAESAEDLINGLTQTWDIMHLAIVRWSMAEWKQTWPGRGTAPRLITRPWVIWHLLEHDLHHGGEISLTLGMHGIQGFGM
jgi:uncharacterized damage-inducible protein DinB